MLHKLNFIKKIDKNQWVVIIVLAGILLTGFLIWAKSSGVSIPGISLLGSSDKAIAQKAIDYINNNGLSTTPAELVAVSRESGLVKVTIKIGTSQFDSYATADGKFLFPQALALDESTGSQAASNNQTPQTVAPENLAKSDTPVLEAYVVAACPYGLQMQRAMAKAVETQPKLAEYIKVRYIGSATGNDISAMHDSGLNGLEAKENLRQVCIREEQASKYWTYVSCYMKKQGGSLPNGMPLGDEKTCMASAGIDVNKINACMSDPARGVAYIKEDFDLDSKYAVQGSPTLILNGQTIDETAFGGRSADGVKSALCAGFNNQPEFCTTQLETTQATYSFSEVYAGAGSSSIAAPNCAPAT